MENSSNNDGLGNDGCQELAEVKPGPLKNYSECEQVLSTKDISQDGSENLSDKDSNHKEELEIQLKDEDSSTNEIPYSIIIKESDKQTKLNDVSETVTSSGNVIDENYEELMDINESEVKDDDNDKLSNLNCATDCQVKEDRLFPDTASFSNSDINEGEDGEAIQNTDECMEAEDQEDRSTPVEQEDKGNELDEQPVDNEEMDSESSDKVISSAPVVGEDLSDENKKLSKATESAFMKLASLGVIAEEKAVEESKESVLKKLASRGSISIIPSGDTSLSISSSSSVSITPTKHNPGPNTMTKQKAKKIKIDLTAESTDIDKDYNSLISFLSKPEGNTGELNIVQKPLMNKKSTDETVIDLKLDAESDINDSCLDQEGSEISGRGVSDDADDKSVQEMDGESHDESKSYSHSSEHLDDSDEKVTLAKVKNVIEEGSAEILLSTTKNVFYNKVQEFNRDMSIAALTVFSEMHQQDPRTRNRGKKRKAAAGNEGLIEDTDTAEENVFEAGKKCENGITILEALSATGLRSIRYAREIPGVKEVIANDLSEDAVETINKNVEHNGVQDIVNTSKSDASMLMYQRQANQEWYDAIDLDPYGCPSRFLDSAVQAVRDGGLLLVTCTDMAVLAGNSPETCYVKYGAVSIRSPACHEMALRIALQCIESHANRYGRYIVPLLSFSADFYIRMIVQVYTSPVTCKRTTSKLSMVYLCAGCHTHTLQPLGLATQSGASAQPKLHLGPAPAVNTRCSHCQYKHHMGGPIWSAPMYNFKFLEGMLNVIEYGRFNTSKRMQGMLEVIREELPDVPLYYTIAGLCTKLHCQAIPLIDIRSAILNTGYRVSSSHATPTAIKTNAPSKLVWDIMRCWVHMNPVSQKRLVPGSVAAAIILEPPNLIANFDIHPKARPSSSMRKLLRYQQNPEKNWGPGMKARCNNSDESAEEKRRANQNKNKNKKLDIIEVVTIDDEDDNTAEGDCIADVAASSTST